MWKTNVAAYPGIRSLEQRKSPRMIIALPLLPLFSELSLRGCRLEMKTPFPLNVPLTLKISAAGELFQSKGRIIYLEPGIGGGVIFLAMEPRSRAVPKGWLETAGKQAQARPA